MAATNGKEFFFTLYVLYCLISSSLYMSLRNLMFNGNNKKNTVFQSNMY